MIDILPGAEEQQVIDSVTSVLADLCARFVINSPQESFQSWERLLFEVPSTRSLVHHRFLSVTRN